MTASLASPYALVGEQTPSQPAHQKSLPPGPPHATAQGVIVTAPVVEAPKAVVRPVKAAVKPVAVPQALTVTTVPALPAEPVVIQTNLPDVPAMGS
jgi:hypothetical protein